MNKEKIQEIENTLKLTKPYNELGSYNYFNCESIEKLLNQYQKLENNWNELKEELEAKINDIKEDDAYDRTEFQSGMLFAFEEMLNIMQEIERRK